MKYRVLLIVATVLSFAETLWADSLAGSRPNIIVVMTDDQGYPPVGRLGHPWIRTPNLDALYDKSTHFTHFFVSPTCAPTRSALMTGRYPFENGVTHTILERERLTLDAVTLPQILKSAGYTTAIFGKWHLGDEDAYQPGNRGFDESFIHGAGGIGQSYDCSCADAPNNTYFDPVIRHNGTFVKTHGFCTDVFFDAALGWINQHRRTREGNASQPFFVYIPTNAPHSPFIAPKKNTDRFRKLGFDENTAGFYGMIENIDENMGRLLAKLDEWQLFDNTVFIFMSDNGMSRGAMADREQPLGRLANGTPLMPYNANMKGLKGSVDEGGVRVPFFIRWDGRLAANRDIDQIAAHIDLLPTLVEFAGAEMPKARVDGRSLVPLLRNPASPWKDRFLFTHRGRWPLHANPDDFKWTGFSVRNQRFRLVGTDQLFDMQRDPGQTVNVIGHHPEVVDDMKSAYEKFWDEARPLMVNENVPLSTTRPYHVAYRKQEKTSGIPDWKKASL
jgi:arylsulfatase A-like enzyme